MLRPRFALAPALLFLLVAARAFASPLEFVSLGDPLEAELRVLELYDPPSAGGRITLQIQPVPSGDLKQAGTAKPSRVEVAFVTS